MTIINPIIDSSSSISSSISSSNNRQQQSTSKNDNKLTSSTTKISSSSSSVIVLPHPDKSSIIDRDHTNSSDSNFSCSDNNSTIDEENILDETNLLNSSNDNSHQSHNNHNNKVHCLSIDMYNSNNDDILEYHKQKNRTSTADEYTNLVHRIHNPLLKNNNTNKAVVYGNFDEIEADKEDTKVKLHLHSTSASALVQKYRCFLSISKRKRRFLGKVFLIYIPILLCILGVIGFCIWATYPQNTQCSHQYNRDDKLHQLHNLFRNETFLTTTTNNNNNNNSSSIRYSRRKLNNSNSNTIGKNYCYNNNYSKDTPLMNHLQVTGSHNSYHKPGLFSLFSKAWSYTTVPVYDQLEKGASTLEFDIHYKHQTGVWNVFHHPVIDSSSQCGCLHDCLSMVRTWSDDNPTHIPIIITIEPKYAHDYRPICERDMGNELWTDLHQQVMSVFPSDRLITPTYIQGDYSNLKDSVEECGWVSVDETRGKVMLVMDIWDENRPCGHHYLSQVPREEQILFIRSDEHHFQPTADSVLFSFDHDEILEKEYLQFAKDMVAKNFLVRVQGQLAVKNFDRDSETRAVKAGAQIVSSDDFRRTHLHCDSPDFVCCNPITTKDYIDTCSIPRFLDASILD